MTSTELLSSQIIELFDDLLVKKNIEVTCDDENEEKDRLESKEDGNTAALYGMEYWGLADKIGELISEHDRRNDTILHNILQELYDKTFDCNYDEFHKYITMEIGITEDEIESLRRKGLYVYLY